MTELLFISGGEIFMILAVVLLLFGAKKIPEVARGLGKGMNELRKATDDIKREINKAADGMPDGVKDLKNGVNDLRKNVTKVTDIKGSVNKTLKDNLLD